MKLYVEMKEKVKIYQFF